MIIPLLALILPQKEFRTLLPPVRDPQGVPILAHLIDYFLLF